MQTWSIKDTLVLTIADDDGVTIAAPAKSPYQTTVSYREGRPEAVFLYSELDSDYILYLQNDGNDFFIPAPLPKGLANPMVIDLGVARPR